MKAIIGTDGSPCAQVAMNLAAALPWPDGSELRVVAAVDPMSLYGPFVGFAPGVGEFEVSLDNALEEVTKAAADQLRVQGRTTDYKVVLGRPSTVLRDAAREMGADVILVGSRGHGSIASMVLGSVSAEVVDHAPCPVLVARGTRLERILLAHYGSDNAFSAERKLRDWPIFHHAHVDVVSVADAAQTWDVMLSAEVGFPPERRGALESESQQQHETIAESSSRRLVAEGHQAETVVPFGDAAHQIISIAGQHGADLIVMGTRGNTGFKRLVLGSVARNVLTHAHCSVLVVPPAS